jgi:hypothetical protein
MHGTAEVIHDHRCATPGEIQGVKAAKASTRTGDHYNLIIEIDYVGCPSFGIVVLRAPASPQAAALQRADGMSHAIAAVPHRGRRRQRW